MTPANLRRTIYGRVSRYRLDEYLQLFDFPPPNISAEKRFSTTVPLQRLFLMNSDFIQAESELLVKRVDDAGDTTAKIRKLYQLIYGRDPSQKEIELGIGYLKNEPMQEYLEKKAAAAADAEKASRAAAGQKDKLGALKNASMQGPDADGAPGGADKAVPSIGGPESEMGEGMMAGVKNSAERPGHVSNSAKDVKYKPTALGRYAKVLLSASEFIYID